MCDQQAVSAGLRCVVEAAADQAGDQLGGGSVVPGRAVAVDRYGDALVGVTTVRLLR